MNVSPEPPNPDLVMNQESPPYDANLVRIRQQQQRESKSFNDAEKEEDISKADLATDEAEASADGVTKTPVKD